MPIDTTPVLAGLLSPEEKAWLNGYHAAIVEKLAPRLTAAERSWLEAKCAPLA